jgi:hypothetical protein
MAAAAIPSIITTVDGRQHERITKKYQIKERRFFFFPVSVVIH